MVSLEFVGQLYEIRGGPKDGEASSIIEAHDTEEKKETDSPYLPLMSVVRVLAKGIVEAYEIVQYNKKTCNALVNRVKAAEVAIIALVGQKDNFQDFCSQDYYNSLKFVNYLKQIKELFDVISQLPKTNKFFSSESVREEFEKVIKGFNECSADLNLAISIATKEQMESDLSVLRRDLIEMKKFLNSSITTTVEVVGPYLPLVSVIGALTKEIVEAYENIQYNKKTCGALVNRIETAEFAVKALMRRKEDNFENFRRQDYYNSFSRFVNCLKQIKKLFDDISQLPKLKKKFSSESIKEKFEKVIKEFNECSHDLNLAISIATKEQTERDLAILREDMIETMKFLNSIEGGITTTIENIAKEEIMVKTMGNIPQAFGPYLPLVYIIGALTKEIVEAYENVQYNKKTCGALVNRVEAAEFAIKALMRRKDENFENFRREDYYNSFSRFVNCLKQIKKLFDDISQLPKLRKFSSSESIKEKFEKVLNEFNECSHDLNLAISIATKEQTEKDLLILHDDMTEMMKFLNSIESGITIELDKIKMIVESITELNEKNSAVEVKAKKIDPLELKDPVQYEKPRQGNRVKIQKKVYNAMDVACKPISVDSKMAKHLAILEKLDACPYIIKFRGLSSIDEKQVMIFEWAELGSLKEVYSKDDIEWPAKISIARDICRAIAFLQSVKILHHDIRCENVLMTEKLQPKLCNFKFARESTANTIKIDDISAMIHWLAPEKLIHSEARYTIHCENFSFGMLLWELAFQKMPYKDWSMLEVQEHVLNGGREKLDFGLSASPVQKEYGEIIKLAWQQEPSFRPGIQQLFNMLQMLYEKYVLNKGSPLMRPLEDESFEDDLDILIPIPSIDDGIKAHRRDDYEAAWECFEANEKVGNMQAKYWCGYYYLEGKHVQKDKLKAIELFKEAADAGNADAQLRYAFCLIDKENNQIDSKKFMRYLQLSADNGNPTALYNLGDVYFSGKLGIKQDKEKGIHYLKIAALKNQPKAKEMLIKNKINLYN